MGPPAAASKYCVANANQIVQCGSFVREFLCQTNCPRHTVTSGKKKEELSFPLISISTSLEFFDISLPPPNV